MTEENIKKIPYGLTDYAKIRTENYYYVDKTAFLKPLEEAGNYLFFIRPRRFGKSLFLAMMDGYYNVLHKERFDELFKGTAIHDNPTAEKNAYMMMLLNFSLIDPSPEKVENSFLQYIKEKTVDFLTKYRSYLGISDAEFSKETEKINRQQSPSDILRSLLNRCTGSSLKVYTIIDEYDNFANTLLTTSGTVEYHKLTHGEGFFKVFFNVLKGGTTGMDAPISRLFMTGVSPITLDDVTSGYNIGETITIDAAFNGMLGFTAKDVSEMLDYYQSAGQLQHEPAFLKEILEQWYGNYRFSTYSKENERLYNSDMVLYFLKEYFKNRTIPKDLVDRNVRIDYGKLRHFITVDSGRGRSVNGNFSRLKQIMEKGEIESLELVDGFPVEKLKDPVNFISLLFYFGLLTIKGTGEESEGPVLTIPNETVKRLYYDYIKEAYDETGTFALDIFEYDRFMRQAAYRGEWKPLFEYITGLMRESMSLRDLITGEKSIQAFLNVYLGLSNLYIIHTEKEYNKGYADILMEPFTARYSEIKYSYLLEIKYLAKAEGNKPASKETTIKRLTAEAEQQVKNYALDQKLKRSVETTTLIKLELVFCGTELEYISRVP